LLLQYLRLNVRRKSSKEVGVNFFLPSERCDATSTPCRSACGPIVLPVGCHDFSTELRRKRCEECRVNLPLFLLLLMALVLAITLFCSFVSAVLVSACTAFSSIFVHRLRLIGILTPRPLSILPGSLPRGLCMLLNLHVRPFTSPIRVNRAARSRVLQVIAMRLRGHLCGTFFPFFMATFGLMGRITSLVVVLLTHGFSERGPFVGGADTGGGVVAAVVRAIMAFKPVRKLARKH
jgi:hypothetical protein